MATSARRAESAKLATNFSARYARPARPDCNAKYIRTRGVLTLCKNELIRFEYIKTLFRSSCVQCITHFSRNLASTSLVFDKAGTVATRRFDERTSPALSLWFLVTVFSPIAWRAGSAASRDRLRVSRVFLSAACESRVRTTVESDGRSSRVPRGRD